ncbi:MAG: UDP-glucose/GDP-mannose dehydrogenase family protein [Candidatus Absconditabacterales bacterium]
MKISVVGIGYVGLIQAVGLAKIGFNITCIDSFEEKIQNLKEGITPIYEDGLESLLTEVKDKISYSIDLTTVKNSDVIFLCVGTPQDKDGKTDLNQIKNAVIKLKDILSGKEIIVIKSTVPVGTNKMVYELLNGKNSIVSNPEFLREGNAIDDFLNTERIILGFNKNENENVINIIKNVYSFFSDKNTPFIITNWETAELIKYTANSFLATKISFMNEIAQLADNVDANIKDIITGISLDSRIGKQFLNAGIGYGGSCFPKDVRSLIHQFTSNGLSGQIVSTVDKVNKEQIGYFMGKIDKQIDSFAGKHIALIGIAFKPDTDDIRESKGIELCNMLVERGAIIHCFDYNAKARINFQNYLNILGSSRFEMPIYIHSDILSTCKDCESLIITIEDKKILQENWHEIKKNMKGDMIFDGRNILDKNKIKKIGFNYIGIGQ